MRDITVKWMAAGQLEVAKHFHSLITSIPIIKKESIHSNHRFQLAAACVKCSQCSKFGRLGLNLFPMTISMNIYGSLTHVATVKMVMDNVTRFRATSATTYQIHTYNYRKDRYLQMYTRVQPSN